MMKFRPNGVPNTLMKESSGESDWVSILPFLDAFLGIASEMTDRNRYKIEGKSLNPKRFYSDLR